MTSVDTGLVASGIVLALPVRAVRGYFVLLASVDDFGTIGYFYLYGHTSRYLHVDSMGLLEEGRGFLQILPNSLRIPGKCPLKQIILTSLLIVVGRVCCLFQDTSFASVRHDLYTRIVRYFIYLTGVKFVSLPAASRCTTSRQSCPLDRRNHKIKAIDNEENGNNSLK